MFEEASRKKLRFKSIKGIISVEDLWDLKLTQLNILAKDINREKKKAGEEDFLKEQTKEDEILKLKFDIVKHVLDTKKIELEDAKKVVEKKEKKEQILRIMKDKKDSKLKDMSLEDLEKELDKLKDT